MPNIENTPPEIEKAHDMIGKDVKKMSLEELEVHGDELLNFDRSEIEKRQ